ncbi:MAG TPA: GyrI-like domain-containing protein [Candidatus Dietzia merdigallinarum]|nr:GyrI-like domain-containing protein [Candidatus Dietzia merdigallinarum]
MSASPERVQSPNVDIKKARRDLYSGRAGRFDVVEVPEMQFLMVDGSGDPNVSADYRRAVEALYTTSYTIRAEAKTDLGRTHTVGPPEGLWYADDLGVFTARDKSAWSWTMMIWQPEWITPGMASTAIEKVSSTKIPQAAELVRFKPFSEGRAVQTLHVGPYDDEGPTIAKMHGEVIPDHGLEPTGHHHEIYLSDPRKSAPEKLRTLLRQPVTAKP